MRIDVRNNIRAVCESLCDVLSLAFQKREPAQPDLATLRTVFNPKFLRDRALVYITADDRCWRWNRYSTATDDGSLVIAPVPATPVGRWHRVSSPVNFGPNSFLPLQSRAAGFFQNVCLYRGDESDEQIDEVFFGQAPGLLVEWLGDDPKPQSLYAGALYRDSHQINLLVATECLRGSPSAAWGSPLPAEYAKDPGADEIIGQLRKVLAGVPLAIPGIEHVELGPARKVSEDLAERILIYSVAFTVRTAFTIPDEDLVPFAAQVTPRMTDQNPKDRAFDALNYVSLGYTVQPGPGLVRTYDPSIAIVAGVPISSTPAAHTFDASKDTYRDLLADGTFAYVVVDIDADEPPATPGALRVARTRTSGADIISDVWLCSSSVQFGGPYVLP